MTIEIADLQALVTARRKEAARLYRLLPSALRLELERSDRLDPWRSLASEAPDDRMLQGFVASLDALEAAKGELEALEEAQREPSPEAA